MLKELNKLLDDIITIQSSYKEKKNKIRFKKQSSLFGLPTIEEDSYDGVITSPPYCNRYDYTRTYALELAYLGVNDTQIKELRQQLLTSTVENKSKDSLLRNHYEEINRLDFLDETIEKIYSNKAFQEILAALKARNENGDINNKGILQMVEGYFVELGLMYAELYRICKDGAKVYFVNDNVRYGGEVIPVDFLSSELAESFGFEVNSIMTIKQQKGNSSQQMKKYGRVALRKSITEWTVRK